MLEADVAILYQTGFIMYLSDFVIFLIKYVSFDNLPLTPVQNVVGNYKSFVYCVEINKVILSPLLAKSLNNKCSFKLK